MRGEDLALQDKAAGHKIKAKAGCFPIENG